VLNYPQHEGMRQLVKDLNHLYRSIPALHTRDCEPEGFQWLIADDRDNSVYAWLRSAPGEKPVMVISNFTPVLRENYRVPLPVSGRWVERFNSDSSNYGGSGSGNDGEIRAKAGDYRGFVASASLTLPPLATLIFEFDI
jgi:1,4-alpha-glucan branching enzyme